MPTTFDPQAAADQLAAENPGLTFAATDDGVYLRHQGKDFMILAKTLFGTWVDLRPRDASEPFETHSFPVEKHPSAYLACRSVVSAV